jgi:hypothetical protein
LATVRDAVRRDLLEDRRRAANDAVLARMKSDYEIAIDEAALDAAAADTLKTAQATP